MALNIRVKPNDDRSKYCVRVTRNCYVQCETCKWKGTRAVNFYEAVSQFTTADQMQELILGKRDQGECPRCNFSSVVFTGVPCATKKASAQTLAKEGGN